MDEIAGIPQRILDKVDFISGPKTGRVPTRCWIFMGSNNGHKKFPYGSVWNGAGYTKAHRYFWEHQNGPIDPDLQVDHICRVTLCVRPSHLEPVTQAENIRRSDTPGMRAVRTNRCKRDHEFTPENTYQMPEGGRKCRTCQRDNHTKAQRIRRAARKAKALQEAHLGA